MGMLMEANPDTLSRWNTFPVHGAQFFIVVGMYRLLSSNSLLGERVLCPATIYTVIFPKWATLSHAYSGLGCVDMANWVVFEACLTTYSAVGTNIQQGAMSFDPFACLFRLGFR